MADTKNRTLRYRRIIWSETVETTFKTNLEYHVKKAHRFLDTIGKRTYPYGEGRLKGISYDIPSGVGGILIHVVYYVPDENTSLVPKPADRKKTSTVRVVRPPKDTDFMKRDIMFYLKNNHLLICPSGVKEQAVKYYLREVLLRSKVKRKNVKFDIEKIANAQKIKLIQAEGVKAVHLNTSLYKASLDYIKRQSQKNSMLKSFSEHVEAIIGVDDDNSRARANGDINAKIVLSVDGRLSTKEELQRRLSKVAEALVDEEDNAYAIETGTGKIITPNEIEINTSVNLACEGNSVSCRHAWQEILQYYGELESDGLLAQ